MKHMTDEHVKAKKKRDLIQDLKDKDAELEDLEPFNHGLVIQERKTNDYRFHFC